MKRVFFYFLCLLFVLLLFKYGTLLYFGMATSKTTILLYVLIGLAGVAIISFSSHFIKLNSGTNIKLAFIAMLVSLLAGELSLRFLLKQNLTYSEKIGGNYFSSYFYIANWRAIKQYVFKGHNFWYLHGTPNNTAITNIEGRKILHTYNSLGLRDKETQPAADDTANLIIGIGDSFTEGIGTEQDSTWLKFLEHGLTVTGKTNVRTLNAGAQGSDVFFEYVLLEKLLEQYRPHTVILAVNTSDIDDIVIRGGSERFKPEGRLQFRKPPVWEPLYATSFIFRAIMHSTADLHWTLLTNTEVAIKQREALDSIEMCIYRFNQLAKQKGFSLVTVFHPREKEIKSGDFPLHTLAAKLSADTTLQVINLKDEYIRTGSITPQNSGNYYWPVDLHHNTAGYKVWGELMVNHVMQKE